MATVWTVERTLHRRFPFRIAIEQDGRPVLAVRAQSKWPGPGQQIFCLAERGRDPDEPLVLEERLEVAHLGQVGRKLVVVLDRPTRKRCEFLVVGRVSQRDGHAYEQVFFRTESGIRAHRSRTRVELRGAPVPHTVVVDSAERYPWRFPNATVERRKLAVGDYALVDGAGRAIVVVERKSFDNLLGDIGAVQALHQHLEDLASLPVAAVVVEAQYADFVDPDRLAGRWPAAHVARVLAELAALHPRLPLVFAGNRKLANAWCAQFFAACAARQETPQLDLVRESLARYEAAPRPEGVEARIRAAAIERAGVGVALRELAAEFPDVTVARVRRVLARLEAEGVLERFGRGRGTGWRRSSPAR
jgi:hypothetical protein